MPTLADIKAADLDRVWFDTARGLAELAQGPAGEIPVRFSNDFAEARVAGDLVVNGSRPVVAVRASDAGPLKRGAGLVVRGVSYRVASVQPGDAGQMLLELERA